MKTNAPQLQKHAGGRPPKFAEPRRPVTVTLPESTLRQLQGISPDRALAIVKATQAATNQVGKSDSGVHVVNVAPGAGLIIVGPSRLLRQIPWLQLAEIAPARYLLSIPIGMSVDSLEIALQDLLDSSTDADEHERAMLLKLRELVRGLRRGKKVSKAEILLVNMT